MTPPPGPPSPLGASPAATGVSATPAPARQIAVMMVESHTVVREGLSMLVDAQSDLQVVAGAGSLGSALTLGLHPDVLVASLDLPDARGEDVVASLRQQYQAAVFVLSLVEHPAFVQQVLAAGAAGYLLKTGTSHELFEGIRAVASGGTFLQPSLGVKLARWRDAGAGVDAPGGGVLSPREVRVLGLIAIGHTNSEVAQLLGVSLRTVETHRARLLQKLGHPNRATLVRYAYELGLVGPGPSR